MKIFDQYASYYDLLYEDKNYSEEVNYIKNLIEKNSSNVTSLLDLGCGTGIHAINLTKSGFQVCGIDFSTEMLKFARQRKSELTDEDSSCLEFYEGDIRKVRLDRIFDVVTSLFHVMSYQITNDDVLDVLSTAKSHLKPGGLFIFDLWYGPGVLSDLPGKRTREVNNEDTQFKRIARPELIPNENTVRINYTLLPMKGSNSEINETHTMRFFFKPELELFLKISGFEMICINSWMEHKEADLDTWNAVVVSRLVN